MREIKFRAWDKDNKEMLYELDNKGYHEDLMKPFDNLDTKSYYEIMQFTGLFDKNGKEIYEGDIVGLSIQLKTRVKKLNVIVEWKKELAGFVPRTLYKKHWEILGNVYENKEMVELLTN